MMSLSANRRQEIRIVLSSPQITCDQLRGRLRTRNFLDTRAKVSSVAGGCASFHSGPWWRH